MLNFKRFLMLEAGLTTPDSMKKTFDSYFRSTTGSVNFDKKNKNRLNFHTTKTIAKEIISSIDSLLGFRRNKLFDISPVTKDENSEKFFHFSITFKNI